jgi:hypothetical protein
MRIGNHGLRDHIRLLGPLLALIAGVWALRMILAAADSPAWLVRVISVTTATSAALLLAVVLIHAKRFGGYASVVVSAFLLHLWADLLIVAAIVFTNVTGIGNIYTAPEYGIPGDDPSHLKHIYGHLTYSVGIGTLLGSAFGCLLLLLLRTLLPNRPSQSSWGDPKK